jgi:xylulokinase
VFLDRQRRVIRPAILWNDQRTAAECDEITQRAGGRAALIKSVANPALTGFTAPKILWLRNHEPRNFKRLDKVLLPKDEIRRRLTGELASDVSDASGTLLLDVVKRRWSTRLLSKLELDQDLLPQVFESEDVTGQLTAEAARDLGLTTACKVVAGAGDCAAGAIGNGVVRPGVLSSSIGTSGVMFVYSDEPQFDTQGRLHTFCHAVRGKWHMMGVNLCSGGSLQWWVQQVLRGLHHEDSPYDVVMEEANSAPVGSGGLVFLPYLSGERTPHADPMARGAFVGLNLSHTREVLTRAILEGVVFALRDSLELIRGLGVPVKEIRVSGGGSKSPLWRQIQADVFGQKVVTLNAEQGPAYGVALLAAVGDGAYTNIQAACKSAISVVEQTVPAKASVKSLEGNYQVYRTLYERLKPAFHSLAQ